MVFVKWQERSHGQPDTRDTDLWSASARIYKVVIEWITRTLLCTVRRIGQGRCESRSPGRQVLCCFEQSLAHSSKRQFRTLTVYFPNDPGATIVLLLLYKCLLTNNSFDFWLLTYDNKVEWNVPDFSVRCIYHMHFNSTVVALQVLVPKHGMHNAYSEYSTEHSSMHYR